MSLSLDINSISSTSCETCNSIFAGIAEIDGLKKTVQSQQAKIEQFQQIIIQNDPNNPRNECLDQAISIWIMSIEDKEYKIAVKTSAVQYQIAQHNEVLTKHQH